MLLDQTELLLDRLILICSTVILRHVTVMNVCSLLADASYLNASNLVRSLQNYMAKNMECLLENRLVEDMDFDLIAQLGKAVRKEQSQKLPVSRSALLVNRGLEKHAGWLALQDIPQPIPRSSKAILAPRHSPRLSPTTPTVSKPSLTRPLKIVPESPKAQSKVDKVTSDDVFVMDDEGIPPLFIGSPERTITISSDLIQPSASRSAASPAWKAKSVPASK